MSKKKSKVRLGLLLKLNSRPVERLENEMPEEYIYRVFKMAYNECEENFDVCIEGVLANSHIRYIKEKLYMIPKRSHHFKNERFYRCEYYMNRNTYGESFFE